MKGESLLTWYLYLGIPKFERSPMGGQIDALEMRAYGSRPCKYKPTGKRAGKTGPCVEGVVLVPRQIVAADGTVETYQFGEWCPQCKGVGYVPMRHPRGREPLTVRPTCADARHQKSAPNDADLTRYAVASRRLSLMPGLLREALLAAYGNDGEACVDSRGRAWAIAPMTQAGKALLVAYQAKHPEADDAYSPVRALTEVARLDAVSPHPKRTELLDEAVMHSIRLLQAAEESWEAQDAN